MYLSLASALLITLTASAFAEPFSPDPYDAKVLEVYTSTTVPEAYRRVMERPIENIRRKIAHDASMHSQSEAWRVVGAHKAGTEPGGLYAWVKKFSPEEQVTMTLERDGNPVQGLQARGTVFRRWKDEVDHETLHFAAHGLSSSSYRLKLLSEVTTGYTMYVTLTHENGRQTSKNFEGRLKAGTPLEFQVEFDRVFHTLSSIKRLSDFKTVREALAESVRRGDVGDGAFASHLDNLLLKALAKMAEGDGRTADQFLHRFGLEANLAAEGKAKMSERPGNKALGSACITEHFMKPAARSELEVAWQGTLRSPVSTETLRPPGPIDAHPIHTTDCARLTGASPTTGPPVSLDNFGPLLSCAEGYAPRMRDDVYRGLSAFAGTAPQLPAGACLCLARRAGGADSAHADRASKVLARAVAGCEAALEAAILDHGNWEDAPYIMRALHRLPALPPSLARATQREALQAGRTDRRVAANAAALKFPIAAKWEPEWHGGQNGHWTSIRLHKDGDLFRCDRPESKSDDFDDRTRYILPLVGFPRVLLGTVPVLGEVFAPTDLGDPLLRALRDDWVAVYGDSRSDAAREGWSYPPLFTEKEFLTRIPAVYYQTKLGLWARCVNALFDEPFMVEPIIYLYPTSEADIVVTLGASIQVSAAEPKTQDGSWRVKATPDGTIIDPSDGRRYHRLYWEGTSFPKPEPKVGDVVAAEELSGFFDDSLTRRGLIAREISEFKDYWLPRMKDSPFYLVRFYDEPHLRFYAPLSVSPAPDTLIRVLMDYKRLDKKIPVQPLPHPATPLRQGFTVVEWGGMAR